MKKDKVDQAPGNNWKRFFDAIILKRGKSYQSSGLVRRFRLEDNVCTAYVEGNTLYRVQIIKNARDGLAMSCNCPYARDGYNCKHMAAALYEWEARYQHEENMPAALFKADENEKKLFYKMSRITEGLEFSANTINEAKKLIQRGQVTLNDSDVSFFYESMSHSERLQGEAVARIDYQHLRWEEPVVTVRFSVEKLKEIRCSVCGRSYNPSYYYYENPQMCAHETAALLLLGDYLKKYNPGDMSDYNSHVFLSEFRKQNTAAAGREEISKSKIITLVPKLTEDTDTYLTFQIGREKLYVVKNLTSLVNAVSNEEIMTLGKNNILDFSKETFTEESEGYYHLIEQAIGQVNALNSRHGQGSYTDEREIRSKINLRGAELDTFYELAYGSVITAKRLESEKKNSVRIGAVKACVHFTGRTVRNKDNEFESVSIEGEIPLLIPGGRYQYTWTDNMFGRLETDNVRALEAFRKITDYSYFSMNFGRKSINEFFYRVLPSIEENPYIDCRIEDEEWIRTQLSPQAKAVFYIDTDSDSVILRGVISYGGREFPLKYPEEMDFPIDEIRDLSREYEILTLVESVFPEYDEDTKCFYAEKTDDTIFNLLSSGLKTLQTEGEVQVSDAFSRLKIRTAPPVTVGVSVESSLLDLKIATQDMSPEELIALLESYRRKKKYHRLSNGDFVVLEHNESLEVLDQMRDDLGISVKEFTKGKLHLPLYRAMYLNEMLAAHEEIAADRDRTFKNIIKNISNVKDAEYDAPETLKNVLRKYQAYGYEWIRTLADLGFGGILADDMGLGKTLQMIAVLLADKEENAEHGTSLIVCPASLVYNWEEEFKKFAPELSVICAAGTASERAKIIADCGKYDAVITSYDLLKRDLALYENVSFRYQIIDEAQYIKNQRAAVSKSVKVIKSEHHFALTGTPIENRLAELWSIFDYLMPGFLYNYETFRTRFETQIVKDQNSETAEKLQRMVAPFILRRRKEDVLKDLPEKIEEIRFARLEGEQRRLYDAQVTHMLKSLKNGSMDSGRDKIKILAELTKIRQICCDPSLIAEDYSGTSAKREACAELIDSAIDGGHKMLVFSQFTSMLELIASDLDNKKIDYYRITGETPKEERLKLVKQFNEDDVPVFLISLKAGGTGLNLTGADIVIHYDPWWNVAAQNQATDRAHRIGQRKQVSVFKLIIKDSIEEKILKMQEDKQNLADAILNGESRSIGQLSKEELMELLG